MSTIANIQISSGEWEEVEATIATKVTNFVFDADKDYRIIANTKVRFVDKGGAAPTDTSIGGTFLEGSQIKYKKGTGTLYAMALGSTAEFEVSEVG